jgi:hypothetical protein
LAICSAFFLVFASPKTKAHISLGHHSYPRYVLSIVTVYVLENILEKVLCSPKPSFSL